MNQNQNKETLRNHFKTIRAGIPPSIKEASSKKIRKKVLDLSLQIQSNQYTALFAGTKNEPNLLPLLEYQNQKWCFPKILDMKNGEMDFFEVNSMQDLKKSEMGILEPKKYCPKISPKTIALVCIPAVTLDKEGNRIGMGRGFYDRYLKSVPHAKKVGIIFPEQISKDSIQNDEWDETVPALVV